MRLIKRTLPLLLALFLAVSPAVLAAPDTSELPDAPVENPAPPASYDPAFGDLLHGSWIGTLHTPLQPLDNLTYFDDPMELNIISDPDRPQLLLTVDSFVSEYTLPRYWHAADGELRFIFNDQPWQASAVLRLDGENTLVGTYTQYNKEYAVAFYRTSTAPKRLDESAQFVFEGEDFAVWQKRLTDHATFSGTGAALPFAYEYYAWEKNQPLLDSIPGLMDLAYNGDYPSDVERMLAILSAFCAVYPHDGASGMPEETDALAVMRYAQAQGAIECRGLAAMLAEILRAFGIPAKAVMCIPYTDPCEDCHVVVHAWSNDLQQWVMLDPTYRLALRDDTGRYLSIPQVRDALVAGLPLQANPTAGHNGSPFSMEYYRAYMTKNMFRFSVLQNAVFENGTVPDATVPANPANPTHMLVPKGWQLPYAWTRPEKVTYNPDAFWASPYA